MRRNQAQVTCSCALICSLWLKVRWCVNSEGSWATLTAPCPNSCWCITEHVTRWRGQSFVETSWLNWKLWKGNEQQTTQHIVDAQVMRWPFWSHPVHVYLMDACHPGSVWLPVAWQHTFHGVHLSSWAIVKLAGIASATCNRVLVSLAAKKGDLAAGMQWFLLVPCW